MDPMVKDMKDGMGNPIAPVDLSKASELGPQELEKLVKEIPDSEVRDIIASTEAMTDTDFSAMEFSIFDYVGFDPEIVSKVLKSYQKHYDDTKTNLLSDIKFSVSACLYMGNLQLKAQNRRAIEGRAKIEYLTRKYNIRTGSQGAGIPATALTFPRIAAAYPVLAVKMAMKLPSKSVKLDFRSDLVPPGMRLTPFGSLCSVRMEEELRTFLLEACNAYGSDMAISYEKGRLKKAKKEVKYDPRTIAHDQWAFMEVASNSKVPEEQERKKVLMKMNLVPLFPKLEEVVRNYRAIMEKIDHASVKVMSESEFTSQLGRYLSS